MRWPLGSWVTTCGLLSNLWNIIVRLYHGLDLQQQSNTQCFGTRSNQQGMASRVQPWQQHLCYPLQQYALQPFPGSCIAAAQQALRYSGTEGSMRLSSAYVRLQQARLCQPSFSDFQTHRYCWHFLQGTKEKSEFKPVHSNAACVLKCSLCRSDLKTAPNSGQTLIPLPYTTLPGTAFTSMYTIGKLQDMQFISVNI